MQARFCVGAGVGQKFPRISALPAIFQHALSFYSNHGPYAIEGAFCGLQNNTLQCSGPNPAGEFHDAPPDPLSSGDGTSSYSTPFSAFDASILPPSALAALIGAANISSRTAPAEMTQSIQSLLFEVVVFKLSMETTVRDFVEGLGKMQYTAASASEGL